WEQPDPAEIVALRSSADWDALRNRYAAPGRDRPFGRCLEVARLGGATTAVIETRYIDSDYRSEFSVFHSKTFAPVPDTTHRLHFFTQAIGAEHLGRLPDDPGYVGYVVVRSTSSTLGPTLSRLGTVGRTMLQPPPEMHSAVRTLVKGRVNFFGEALEVEAAPFMEQDTRLLRCAHVAAWMYHRPRRRQRPPRPPQM
ncbi:MAG: hypothetical protein HW416_3588, partial [Chloroflexi bacterium]|nr:hypothetical protein [Chloroflexota bacterium]